MGIKTNSSHQSSRGFTIVELLITIVVIGVISGIVIVAYNGVSKRAMNTNRVSEFQGWVKLFKLYKSEFGSYPNVPHGTDADPLTYCLGTGFPIGPDGEPRCRDYHVNCLHSINPSCTSFRVIDSTALMTELQKSGRISATNKIAVGGTVGPYAEFFTSHFTIQGWFDGGPSDCPKGTTYSWDDGAGRLACYQSFLYTE